MDDRQLNAPPQELRWADLVAKYGLATVLIVLAVGAAGLMVWTTVQRTLTPLEGTLFQLLIFGLGLAGSFLFGRRSAAEAARDVIKPHARSAFRRVWSLYQSLSRLAVRIQSFREESGQDVDSQHILDVLEAMVIEQIGTGTDALEDWRDVVPEEVADLERRLQKRHQFNANESDNG